MTILEENHHSFLIVEHDPLLYEDAEKRMVEYLAQALRQTSREATILLYAPALDPHLQKIAGLANPGVLHLRRAGQRQEGRGEDAGSAENAKRHMILWPRLLPCWPIERCERGVSRSCMATRSHSAFASW